MSSFFFKRKVQYLLFIYIFLLSIKSLNSQDLEAKCDGSSIKYTVQVNLSEYLENENNIDKREFYTLDSIKSKKLGKLKDFDFNKTEYSSITEEYEEIDDLLVDLKEHKIDGIITDLAVANETQMLSNEFSRFGPPIERKHVGFGIQKGNTTLQEQLNALHDDPNVNQEQSTKKWYRINYLSKYIDKNLSGENGKLNVALKLKDIVYSFKDENNKNEAAGIDVELLYEFAKVNGYDLNIIEVNTYDEQIEFLKNKSVDIAGGYFILKNESKYTDYVDYTRNLHPVFTNYIVRYENLKDSAEWGGFYNSVEEFDGEPLGYMPASAFVDLTKNNFPNSKLTEYDDIFDLYMALLLEEIEGFLVDEPIAQYFKILYPERVTYFEKDFGKNEYGFGFSKDNELLLKEFNEFLSEANIKEIYNKWNVEDTSNLTIDKDLDTNASTITAAFYLDHKPLSFRDRAEFKGYEIELIYKFAKEYGYNVNIIECTIEERITLLEDGKANITGGWFIITDERKERINFSNSIHQGGTVLAVRKDCKKDEIKLKIVGNNYNEKGNKADLKVKFPNTYKTSTCTFPDDYNETILVNCEIDDLSGIDPYSEGFTFDSSNDSLKIVYTSLRLDNLFNANSLLNKQVITESDKSNTVCKTNSTYNSYNKTNSTYNSYNYSPKKKNSGGLSTGGIIGIIIPCCIALVVAVALAIGLKSPSVPAFPTTFRDSENQINQN